MRNKLTFFTLLFRAKFEFDILLHSTGCWLVTITIEALYAVPVHPPAIPIGQAQAAG